MKIYWAAWPVRRVQICDASSTKSQRRARVSIRPEQCEGFTRRVVRLRSLAPCMRHIALAMVVATFFVGCAVGPNYKRPEVAAPTQWKETASTNATLVMPTNWWTIFGDAELDRIETQAITANQDLKRAVARVTEARAIARLSEADVYPRVTASGGHSLNHLSKNQEHAPRNNREYEEHFRQVDLEYEIDAWGRVRRSIEAGKADYAAIETDLQVVLLTLTSDVARNYQSLRSLDREKQVTEATVALRLDAVRLQETRNKAGLINEVDVTRARTELANVEAELHSINRSRAQVEHALAVLCGQAPAGFTIAAPTKIIAVPEIPAGLPSSLLERRPDVVEAEQKLHAECARIGVAKAAFFPTIKLTGASGATTADLGLLLNPHSRFWQIGPSIHFPIFEGGRNSANLKAAEARFEQAVASYRSSVLNAFREVEDSLSDINTLRLQGEAVNRALASARDTAALAAERYERGLSSYLDVVDAQRAVLQAERTAAQLGGQRNVSTILLAKAVGGGWRQR